MLMRKLLLFEEEISKVLLEFLVFGTKCCVTPNEDYDNIPCQPKQELAINIKHKLSTT